MSLGATIYNVLFRRTSTMALTCVAGAFIYERSLGVLTELLFDTYNEGKQFKDVKKRLDLH